MKRIRARFDKHTVQGKMNRLLLQMVLPIVAILITLFAFILTRNLMYASVSGNIVKASGFNQNFKNEVDLKMYLYVSGSSDKIPWDDVYSARMLAGQLLKNTTNPESRKALNNVLTLCDNLSNNMRRIQQTKQYEQRMDQLDTNIYGVTQLIEDYIYKYLYHEAGEMALLQKDLDFWLTMEVAFVIILMVIMIPIVLGRSMLISRSITKPIEKMKNRVEGIGHGDLHPQPPVKTDDKGMELLSSGIEDMALRLNKQIELNRQEQIRLNSMELQLIQAQINPHFLYNTLDAIVWLIETEKNEQAVEMVSSLSNYFRSFLSNGKDILPLHEELLHVRSYLEIQQVRYSDILTYDILTDPSLDDCLIPKMTLQPLVENAIYHGIKPKRGIGRIVISSACEGSDVILKVSDNGVGMSPVALQNLRESYHRDEGNGFGLLASYKRLKLMYGEALSFQIESEENRGTEVIIRIPYRTEVAT